MFGRIFGSTFRSLASLLAVATILFFSLALANVDDPAKDVAPYHTEFPLFRSANMNCPDELSTGIGFHSFRIPTIVTTKTGRILAFAEGRRFNRNDWGDINLVYKRTKATTSHGASESDWESLQEVICKGDGTWGSPTPVVDGDTIYLFMSWNDGQYSQNGDDDLPNGERTKKVDSTWEGRRHLCLTKSTDDGKTWSTPEDLTKTLTPDGKAWDAVANGRNIVGRGTPGQRTWTYQSLPGVGSEGTIAQTPNGKLYRNDRAGKPDDYTKVARGDLSSFGAFALDTGLPDPACEASTLLYNLANDAGPARVLFKNSAHKDL
ncbi:unnamed protein product [Clonostachys rhizophaga]|uniref:Sialidase domain-containing protein n=1 Tax=Clonostachys rhizophaga TaxID=160324 RepID=A0A9N9W350_9HYPO|nr:unnamed protein product [Clonostachys rhizophaga]